MTSPLSPPGCLRERVQFGLRLIVDIFSDVALFEAGTASSGHTDSGSAE